MFSVTLMLVNNKLANAIKMEIVIDIRRTKVRILPRTNTICDERPFEKLISKSGKLES